MTRHEETSIFQKRSVPRVFAFCSFNCFRNNLERTIKELYLHNRNKGRQISEQSGPLAANWNTKFLFVLVKRNNWFHFYPFRNKKVLFQQFRFPFMFLSKWLGNKCSQSNFLLYTVRNKLFLFTGISTAVRNALFPFGSNCSYSCPTGTELFLIEVVFCSSRWVLCSAYKWEQVPNLWQRN